MSCFMIGEAAINVLLLRLGHQGREGLDVRMTSIDVELIKSFIAIHMLLDNPSHCRIAQ